MMQLFPWVVTALAVTIAIWAVKYGLKERRRRKGRPLFDRSPVRLVSAEEIDPIFKTGPLGYSIETEVAMIGDTGGTATTSETEAWILCVLAKRARRAFEFGTASGRTAYLMARNMPEDAEVVTLTLSPDTVDQYVAGWEDDVEEAHWEKVALGESVFTSFFYQGTPEARKIRQLFGDSKVFDDEPYADSCDLVFIDGGHAYSYVQSDSEKAMRMVREGGFIIWHDFSPATSGVWRYLNELGREIDLVHVRNTRLVIAKF